MIDIERLQFGYGRGLLYDGFDLQLATPGLHGLFGRNGSGKSTLLKLVAGLVFRSGGAMRVAGYDPQARDPRFLAQVYLVPEDFHLPDLSSDRLARLQAGFYPRFDHALFARVLETFELDPKASFGAMSLGGRKKAAMAFALATRTPLLLLDEPTNGMDIVARDQLRALLRAPEQADRIVLISTHQAHDLEQVIAHVLFIDGGRLALSADMARLAASLRMGVADAGAVDAVRDVLYREPIGGQTAYIARRGAGTGHEPVQLELLYRALCRAPEPILAALERQAPAHV